MDLFVLGASCIGAAVMLIVTTIFPPPDNPLF